MGWGSFETKREAKDTMYGGAQGPSLSDILKILLNNTPDDGGKETLMAAKAAVDSGMTNCPCGEPDCEFGIAIRAEVARRRGSPTSSLLTHEDIVHALRTALSSDEVVRANAAAQVQAYETIRQKEHERAWTTRLGRFVGRCMRGLGKLAWRLMLTVVLLVLGVLWVVVSTVKAVSNFIWGTFNWKKKEEEITQRLKKLKTNTFVIVLGLDESYLRTLVARITPRSLTAGYRFGEWLSGRPAAIRQRLVVAGQAIASRFPSKKKS